MMNVLSMDHPRTHNAFRNVKRLVVGYLGLGVLALVATALLRNDSAEVNSAVWTRGVIVIATALLLLSFSVRASRGSRGAYRRLRVVSIVTPVAIAVIIALPGTFPLWMKIEQGVCGVVMIFLAVIVNRKHLRALFAATKFEDGCETRVTG